METLSITLAFIDGLGGGEMGLLFVLVLVLFGGKKLPEFARGLGKTVREFKKAAAGVEEEFKRALDEDERQKNAALTAATTPAIMPPANTTPATLAENSSHPDLSSHDEYHGVSETNPVVGEAANPPPVTSAPAPVVPPADPSVAPAELKPESAAPAADTTLASPPLPVTPPLPVPPVNPAPLVPPPGSNPPPS